MLKVTEDPGTSAGALGNTETCSQFELVQKDHGVVSTVGTLFRLASSLGEQYQATPSQ